MIYEDLLKWQETYGNCQEFRCIRDYVNNYKDVLFTNKKIYFCQSLNAEYAVFQSNFGATVQLTWGEFAVHFRPVYFKGMNLYEVGGCIRDEFLGETSKDIDYSVEMIFSEGAIVDAQIAYQIMNEELEAQGFGIFLKSEHCFTTRAHFPEDHKLSGTADFVLCRRETYDGTSRTPATVELGTLKDDLMRRDFTCNAMARDIDGNLIDYFGGKVAAMHRILKCPISAEVSFSDDPLRLIRALRFKVTKGFSYDNDIYEAIATFPVQKMKMVSIERIYDELMKMFKHNTLETFSVLNELYHRNYELYKYILTCEPIWFKPTLEKR